MGRDSEWVFPPQSEPVEILRIRVAAMEDLFDMLLAYLPPQHLYNPAAFAEDMTKLRDARDEAISMVGRPGAY